MSNYEESSSLPEYAQNILPELTLPTLVLISHGHSPPLNPPPRLKFDVRSLPNPPKNIRDAHNGTSKRLQEWLNVDSRFIAKRDAIKAEIEAAMNQVLDEHERKDVLQLELVVEGKRDRDEDGEVETRENSGEDEESAGSEEEGTPSIENHETTESPSSQEPELRVGIFCAMGRHRSVALVEDLSRLSWPGWEVRVEHRDISKKRGAGKKTGSRQSRGTRGGTLSPKIESE
jgi:hypothetical protein